MFDKKGNFLDWFFILVILLLTAIVLVCSKFIVDTVDDTGVFSGNSVAQGAIDDAQDTLLSFDNLMLFVIVGLSLFVLLSSAMVSNHPAMFFVSILLLFIAIVIAASISNSFWIFANSSELALTAAMYPKLTFLMDNLPFYILFMGMAAAVAMFVDYRR